MAKLPGKGVDTVMGLVRHGLGRIEFLALFPVLVLLASAVGSDDLVLAAGLILPTLLALQALAKPDHATGYGGPQVGGGGSGKLGGVLPGQDAMLAMLERVSRMENHDTACIIVQIDEWDDIVDLWGRDGAEDIAQRAIERLCTSLRRDDMVARLGDARFGIVLHPLPTARLGVRDALVSRLRGALGEPIALGGGKARVTVCAGHSGLIRDSADPAAATLVAAEAALAEAHLDGPNVVRAYAPGIVRIRRTRTQLAGEVEAALAAGEIRPWFQPQVCSDTGVLSGFEALARWHHPQRGVLVPGEFLQAIKDAGRMEALGHTILVEALEAIQAWDTAGIRVPSVSVNFSAIELSNPSLADRVMWEIDRFDLRPGRLTVEILETVAAETADDTVIATLNRLGVHGINLDLDDFGVGQASLAAIRRFGVSRIKIDKSFVLGVDTDPQQHAMVSAVLAMAHHLGVETLAEGVETEAVQTLLAQMGCNHVQGYFISRPLPFQDTFAWATAHNERIAQSTLPGRRAG